MRTHVAKIAITINSELLQQLDELVKQHYFKNRSQAIQQAIEKHIQQLEAKQFAAECEKLNPSYEQELADEGLQEDSEEWPDY